MNRRHFIAIASLSVLSGSTLVSVNAYQWWDVPPQESYHFFSEKEGQMVVAISRALFPSGEEIPYSGGDLQLDRFFDQLLLELGETEQKLIKFFLHFIEKSAYLSSIHKGFLEMEVIEQQAFLEGWLQNSNHLLRNALLSIVALLCMGYTSHPQVSPRLAIYHRCGFG
jgi:hypothetical protein